MTNAIIAQLVSLVVAAAFGAVTGYLASRLKTKEDTCRP